MKNPPPITAAMEKPKSAINLNASIDYLPYFTF
jgi:hypothetical protein